MKKYKELLNDLTKRYDDLISRRNKINEKWYNGIFDRYENPVLTNEHIPLEWRYDLNEETNPYLLERIGVNAVFNSGAVYLDGKYVLVARVEAILRRTNKLGDASEVKKAGAIVLDKTAHEVKLDGKTIDLSFKEFELLDYFLDNQGIALSRERILNSVWNYDYFGDARTIDTHVKKLRSKLGEHGDYIKTVWGMGYKFEV